MTLLKATVDSVLVLQAPVYYLNIFCINFVMKLNKLNCSLCFFSIFINFQFQRINRCDWSILFASIAGTFSKWLWYNAVAMMIAICLLDVFSYLYALSFHSFLFRVLVVPAPEWRKCRFVFVFIPFNSSKFSEMYKSLIASSHHAKILLKRRAIQHFFYFGR